MDMRVFWAVLGALCVFALLVAAVSFAQQRAEREARQQAWQGVLEAARTPDPMGLQALAASRRRVAAQSADVQRQRRQLLGGQRCVGGVVVVVEGSTYTQLGSIANPVRCAAGYADRPLR